MKTSIRVLPMAISMLLAACASAPTPIQHPAAPIHMTPAINVENIATPAPSDKTVADTQDTGGWDQLRATFAMSDCDADPSILQWAHRYTQNPRQFENQMAEVLPRLAYVQQVAASYDVAGEFVLLPWIESHFQTSPGHRNRPAGIWQIVPTTAGSMGLHVDGKYDARLDVSASAHAVMKLLKTYHDELHDWRLADYAYNAGEFKIRKMAQSRGLPPDSPVIPKWPVQRVTREHLTKLLAIACVVREPDRFHVSLPSLQADEKLVQVDIPHSMPMTQAAAHAGISLGAMKELNAAFRSDMIDAGTSRHLLMPASHVDQFQTASLNPSNSPSTEERSTAGILAADQSTAPMAATPSTRRTSRKTHKVKRGESLWQIAHHYSLNVTQLQQWNHLRGQAIKPGQVLQLGDED
ncbi:LysM peptidoglycan-binding domain-containing protein [Rhodanobacter sp. L36]|uniref:LysM peptidoglycan-binding domain-containing protein n=1 Tax=Rhodanobacter sp. L36 TaxID=1747221 RepID=UPI0020B174A7|nr:LysM peptidoglycan-binding domain-containing protein [Rhodanobacter sp. L36]